MARGCLVSDCDVLVWKDGFTYVRILQILPDKWQNGKVRTLSCGKKSRCIFSKLKSQTRQYETRGPVKFFNHEVSSRQGLTSTSNVNSVSTPSLWKDLQIISICLSLCFSSRKLAARGDVGVGVSLCICISTL